MRKNTSILLSLFFLSILFYFGQSSVPAAKVVEDAKNVRISIADTSNNAFFREHGKLKEIWRTLRNNELSEIRLRYLESDNRSWSSEYYDMDFEGDAYVFMEKYKNSIHFVEPTTDFESIYGNNVDCLNNRLLRTTIFKDSVYFDFRQDCSDNGLITKGVDRNDLGVPAKYSGDLVKLSQLIQQKVVNGNSHGIQDSIVVFRGIVNADGSMENLVLEAGKQSFFSDVVKDVLNSPAGTPTLRNRKNWLPARTERGPRKSNIRIYAKLNKDLSVNVSTTRLLGTLTVIN